MRLASQGCNATWTICGAATELGSQNGKSMRSSVTGGHRADLGVPSEWFDERRSGLVGGIALTRPGCGPTAASTRC